MQISNRTTFYRTADLPAPVVQSR